MDAKDLHVNGLYLHKRRGTYAVVEILNEQSLYYRIKFTKRRIWIEKERFLREWKPLEENSDQTEWKP